MLYKLELLHPRHFPFWRRITPKKGLPGKARGNDWLLVLNAVNIPFQICRVGRREHVYVPPLYETLALYELKAFQKENASQRESGPRWRLYDNWQYAPAFLIPLLFLYLSPSGKWTSWIPSETALQKIGSLDAIRVYFHGEWWRLITALSLHANAAHIAGNLFFGAIFLCLLARLCGVGRAWLLTFLGGLSGNAISLLLHDFSYNSIGFSTALFACAGSIGALAICRSSHLLFAPFAAVLALLAMLGTEGAHTDYVAHICGMGAGFLLGMLFGIAQRYRYPMPSQWLCAIMAIAGMASGWLIALANMR